MSVKSYVVEAASGVRILPTVDGDPLRVNEWVAHLACDADLRRRVPEYARVAGMLVVTPAPTHEHRLVQHRDGMPPWCKVCGRDSAGRAQRTVQS